MISLSEQNSKHRRFTPKQFSIACLAILSRRNSYQGGSQKAKAASLLPLTFFFFFLAYTLDLIPCTSAAYAASTVTLAWDKNAETDVIGYKVHYGKVSRNYQYTVDVKNNTSCSIAGLAEGTTYYFAATAYNNSPIESDYSKELAHTIPNTPPPPPPVDTDGDELFDDDETGIYGTDPNKADIDGDGINDGNESALGGDSWSDDSDKDELVNLVDPDSDHDGYNDGTSPPPPDPPLQLPTLEVGEAGIDHTEPASRSKRGSRTRWSWFSRSASINPDTDSDDLKDGKELAEKDTLRPVLSEAQPDSQKSGLRSKMSTYNLRWRLLRTLWTRFLR